MTTNVILTMDRDIDNNILYWSILELFRDLGIVVNSNKSFTVSSLHYRIKELKDELWNKILWCINTLKLSTNSNLLLVKVRSIQLSEVKVIISLRYENE